MELPDERMVITASTKIGMSPALTVSGGRALEPPTTES